MRLNGQQDRRHELIHALGGQARTLGLEGEGLEADESSLKVITMIRRRASVSVAFTMQSTTRLLLVIDHHAAAGEPAIGVECEMARLSLRAVQ